MKISARNAKQIRAGILLARALMNEAALRALRSPDGRGKSQIQGLTSLMARAFDREEPKARARVTARYAERAARLRRTTQIPVRVRKPES